MKIIVERPECWRKDKLLINPVTGKTSYPMTVNGKTAYEVDDLYGEKLLSKSNNGLFAELKEKVAAKPKEQPKEDVIDEKKLRADFRDKMGYPPGRMSVEKMLEKMNDTTT